jgi:hypothetical protein
LQNEINEQRIKQIQNEGLNVEWNNEGQMKKLKERKENKGRRKGIMDQVQRSMYSKMN